MERIGNDVECVVLERAVHGRAEYRAMLDGPQTRVLG
jgi:formyltetrahydrofolate hydrolase